MNPGMYPLIDPQAQALRKLAGQVRSGTAQTTWSPVVLASGAGAVSISLTSGVRTRAVGASGRGAIRWMHAGAPAAGVDLTLELVVDGQRVMSQLVTLPAASGGSNAVYVMVGGGLGAAGTSQASAFWDWIPFDSSVELYMTANASVACTYGVVFDLHQ